MTSRRLLFVLAVALLMRLFFWAGIRGSDDLHYMQLGHQHAQGTWSVPRDLGTASLADLRLAFAAPQGLSLRLFGASEASFLLYPLLCSLAMVALLYAIAARWLGPGPGLATGLAAALLPGYVLAGSSLYPDLPPALWITLSLALFWAAPEAGRLRIPAAAASGLAFGLAVNHKETAFLLLPCLLLLGMTASRRRLLPWVLACMTIWFCTAWDGYVPREVRHVLGVYSDPALKHKPGALYDSTNPLLNTSLNASPSMTRRLCWDFTRILASPLDTQGFPMWAGILYLAAGGAWLAWRRPNVFLKGCAVWAALGFLSLNTVGIPGRGYFPIHPISPRYLGLVMPPFLLLAGAFLAWLWEVLSAKGRWILALGGLATLLVFNEMTVTPNRDLSRTLRLVREVLEREGDRDVWTDERTGQALSLITEGIRIHPLLAGQFPPEGALTVLNGPKLAYFSFPARPLLRTPPADWVLLDSRHVMGMFGKGNGDPERRAFVYRAGRRPIGPVQIRPVQPRPGISARQQIIAAIVSIGLIVFIFELVRRRRLREEYSWLWMLSGAVILLFALCYPALGWVTDLIGAKAPTSTLFFFGFFFLILICIHYAVKVSTLTMQVKNLMQELAILSEEQGERKDPARRRDGPPPGPTA